MKLFIDTTDPAQVKEDWEWGIIDGVTTNPSHVSKTERPAGEIYREICVKHRPFKRHWGKKRYLAAFSGNLS